MAIQTTSQGNIPAVTIDKLQFTRVNIEVVKSATNHKIKFSATVHPYGVDINGDYVFDGTERKIVIPDMTAFIMAQTGTDLTDLVAAMQKCQESFGELAEKYFDDITFDQYVS